MATIIKKDDEITEDGGLNATDPTQRYATLFSGVQIGNVYNRGDGGDRGTLGCFIHTTGLMDIIPEGDYLLSCEHVLYNKNAGEDDIEITQPSFIMSGYVPDNVIGKPIYGKIEEGEYDCAISSIVNRNYENKVPAAPFHIGKNKLAGIRRGELGEKVYKFGASSGYTTGIITAINNNQYTITNNDSGFAGGGDSGSLLMSEDNFVLGLIYAVGNHYLPGGLMCTEVYAYDMQTQLDIFADPDGEVTLA